MATGNHANFQKVSWVLCALLVILWALAAASSSFGAPEAPFTGVTGSARLTQGIAILATAAVTVIALVRRQWIVVAVLIVASIASAIGVSVLAEQRTINSLDELLQAESHLHGEFVRVSQAFEDGGNSAVGLLPDALELLSRDDTVRVTDAGSALYISVWENWRGEAGGGFMYTHDPSRPVPVGPGYGVRPRIDLGDGWWYAEGS